MGGFVQITSRKWAGVGRTPTQVSAKNKQIYHGRCAPTWDSMKSCDNVGKVRCKKDAKEQRSPSSVGRVTIGARPICQNQGATQNLVQKILKVRLLGTVPLTFFQVLNAAHLRSLRNSPRTGVAPVPYPPFRSLGGPSSV